MLALVVLLGTLLSLGASNGMAQVPFTVIDSDPNRYPAYNGVWLFPSQNHMVRDSSGTIYVIYTLATNQYIHYYNYVKWSSDGGSTWSDAVRNDFMPDSSSTQSLVIDPAGVLYEGFTFNVNPFFTKSTDGGKSWPYPSVLDYNTFTYHPSMVMDGNGTLHEACMAAYGWFDYPFNIVYKKSTDGGDNWSDRAVLTTVPHDLATYGYGAEVPDLYAGKNGNLFILYTNYTNSTVPYRSTKMFLHFDGTGWSDPMKVSADDISSGSGDLAVDSTGTVHLAYSEKDGTTGNYRVVYRTYDPVAKAFSSPRPLTPATVNTNSITMGIYAGDLVVIAYDRYDLASGQFGGVYATTSADNFTSFKRISTHPNARTPNLRSSFYNMNQPDKVDLVWVEPNDVSGGEELAYTELSGGIANAGSLVVNVYGPKIANPGQQAVYLVRYRNGMAVDSENTVVKVGLPGNLPFVSSTGGGVYLRQTNEVVWSLGTVPAGGQGSLAFTLYVPWGEASGSATVVSKIDSTTSPWHIMDITPYLNPVSIEVASNGFLSADEIAALLASDARLARLHGVSLSRGLDFYNVAKRLMLKDGRELVFLVYLKMDPYELAFLSRLGDQYSLVKANESGIEFFDEAGGLMLRLDGAEIPYGEWTNPDYEGPVTSVPIRGFEAPVGDDVEISYWACLRNCEAMKGVDVVGGHVVKTAWNVGKGAYHLYKREGWEVCKDAAAAVSEAAGEVIDFVEMGVGCPAICLKKKWRKDYYCPKPSGEVYEKWCVSEGMVGMHKCSADNMFNPLPYLAPCLEGQVCSGGECVDKGKVCPLKKSKTRIPLMVNGPVFAPVDGSANMCDDDTTDITPAHDPNAKSVDPMGDVVPGQTLTYTIEYENTGVGTAYSVFVLDTLDPNLEESTLSIGNGGEYSIMDRLLSWEIGDLSPNRQGSVVTTIKVREGIPSGTQIVNMAEVHFPSASEITPTNPVVSLVKAIAADPKSVETVSGTPVPIVLSGRDSGSNPLTYRITTNPIYGDLVGTPPNVTYSAMPGFSGQEEFYYVVGNGLVESAPAKVIVRVGPDPSDTTPPSVIGTYPAGGTPKVHFDATPLSTDPYQYIPTVTATFSKPIDPATLTASTFTVDGLAGSLSYSEPLKTASFKPSTALSPHTVYTARLTAGITDKIGNPLGAEYSWQFTTESPANIVVSLPDNGIQVIFGSLNVGQSTAMQTVNVTNTGTQDLTIGTILPGGANPDDFVITDDQCSGATLAQSTVCTLTAGFSPKAGGTRNGLLNIPSNDIDTPVYGVALTGVGIQQYTLTVTYSSGGIVTPGTVTVNLGVDQTFNILVDTGHHVVDVKVDGASQGAISSYSFTNVSAPHTIGATFAVNTYTLTVTHSSGGTVTPGTVTVNYGVSQTFNILADTGYHVVDVKVDGASQGAISSYSFTNVSAPHTIGATFAVNTYTLTVTHSSGGTVTPGTVTVNYGVSQTFNILADTGYHVVDVKVDSASQGVISSYSFTNVTAPHTIDATFAINTFTLTVTHSSGGTVTPGTVTVNYGVSQTFNILADTGYHVVDVKVDGASQGAISSYSFVSVTAPHAIDVVFAIDTHTLTVVVTGAGKGTVTSVPPGVDCGNGHADCSPVYDYNTVVALAVHPDSSSVFAGWSGSGCSGKDPCSVTMDAAKSVTATFSHFLAGPPRGTYGTEIVLAGPGFGTKKGKVLLDTLSLKISSWQEGEIRCLLTKSMFPGTYPIVILPKEPKGTSIQENNVFTAGKVSDISVEPNNGKAGDLITLSGSLFGTKKGKVYLEYAAGGVVKRKTCKVVGWPATSSEGTGEAQVQFIVPKGIPSSSVCDVVVSNPMGEARLVGGFSVP